MVICLRTACNLVDDYWHFRGTSCLQLQNTSIPLKAADFFELHHHTEDQTMNKIWAFHSSEDLEYVSSDLWHHIVLYVVSYLLSGRWRWQVPLLVGKKELVCPFIHTFYSGWTNFYAAWSFRLRCPKESEFVMMYFYEIYETDLFDSKNTNCTAILHGILN